MAIMSAVGVAIAREPEEFVDDVVKVAKKRRKSMEETKVDGR